MFYLQEFLKIKGIKMKLNFVMSKLVVTMLAVLTVTGCATVAVTGSADVEKAAFTKNKKYAVVSIASMKTFQGEKGMVNMFKSMEDIPGTNTQPIVDNFSPKALSVLGSSKYFTLVPEKALLASKAYKNLIEDPKVMKVMFMSFDMNESNKYKYISDEKKYAQLAKELGVDGVIGLTLNFTVTASKGSFSINGIGFGKKSYSAMSSISIVAYDANGKVVWKDSTLKEAEPGDSKAIIVFDTSDITGTSFEKFHPSALEMAGKGMETLYARFDDTMNGKSASMFQSVK